MEYEFMVFSLTHAAVCHLEIFHWETIVEGDGYGDLGFGIFRAGEAMTHRRYVR